MIRWQIRWAAEAAKLYDGIEFRGPLGAARFLAHVSFKCIHLMWNYLLIWLMSLRKLNRAAASRKVVAILLSHNRPQNMEFIVRTLLSLPEISEVVVSNSNTNVCIADFITSQDPRLLLTDEKSDTKPGYRFVLAQEHPSRLYLSIDDDFFLSPWQIRKLICALAADPSVPHGLRGDNYSVENGQAFWTPIWWLEPWGSTKEKRVDTLIGVYAFTSDHLARYFEILQTLGIFEPSMLSNGEDIIMSNSMQEKSIIHNFGFVLDCMSSILDHVALHKCRSNFVQERVDLYQRLRSIREIRTD